MTRAGNAKHDLEFLRRGQSLGRGIISLSCGTSGATAESIAPIKSRKIRVERPVYQVVSRRGSSISEGSPGGRVRRGMSRAWMRVRDAGFVSVRGDPLRDVSWSQPMLASGVHRPAFASVACQGTKLATIAAKPRIRARQSEQPPQEAAAGSPQMSDERLATAMHGPKRPDGVARLADVLNACAAADQHVAHLHPGLVTLRTRWRFEHRSRRL